VKIDLKSCPFLWITTPHRHWVDPALDPILLRDLNQYDLTPNAVWSQCCDCLSGEFRRRECGLRIPAPRPELLSLWFIKHVHGSSTASLAGKLTGLSETLTLRVTRLISMTDCVSYCEQRGFLIANQTRVLFVMNEYIEFLMRQFGNSRGLPEKVILKSWR
jgi:hypothetical protein